MSLFEDFVKDASILNDNWWRFPLRQLDELEHRISPKMMVDAKKLMTKLREMRLNPPTDVYCYSDLELCIEWQLTNETIYRIFFNRFTADQPEIMVSYPLSANIDVKFEKLKME